MNRTTLIENIMVDTGLSKKDATAALKSALTNIETAVVAGEKVQLIGFGTFDARDYAARPSVLKTHQLGSKKGETYMSDPKPAGRKPGFKPGKAFKEKMNA